MRPSHGSKFAPAGIAPAAHLRSGAAPIAAQPLIFEAADPARELLPFAGRRRSAPTAQPRSR